MQHYAVIKVGLVNKLKTHTKGTQKNQIMILFVNNFKVSK